MRTRWLVLSLCLLCLAGAWVLWRHSANTLTKPSAPPKIAASTANPAATAPHVLTAVSTNGAASAKTNLFALRLSNTTLSLDQLMGDRHAILLENALIDTASPLNLGIPKNLQSQGDPGAYIVQARGPIDAAFRAMLARAGAEIVSYIPNNAYLVYAPAGAAGGLAGNPLTQSVTPYEPYYKISSSMPVTAGQKTHSAVSVETNRTAGPSLLELAVKQLPLPAGTYLTLGLFKDSAAATVARIEKLGGRIIARDNSPFGPVVRVQPPKDWVALAALPGVQIVEPCHQRAHANDLSRATVGVAADTQVMTNYMGLTGSNVLVQVNDSGIDATHPDLINRVFGDSANLVDTDGHGTHVAGIIAGDGTESLTVTNAPGSFMPATTNQFRGKAPLANLLSMDWGEESDQDLQETAAEANALISNNSWNYGGDYGYDLAAASYDAAVRDALPGVTGSQPVLFVFSAGNDGGGSDDGTGGNADTILSPATAKNVITVGAIEQFRYITNIVTALDGTSNDVWRPETDTSSQVAGFSSRGNVGIGTEGTYGRFKPDVVAPGTFVVSTRSSQWDQYAYYNPTNYDYNTHTNLTINANTLNLPYGISVKPNAVGVFIIINPNRFSATTFPTNLAIYVRQSDYPATNAFDFVTWSNGVSIPPDGPGNYLQTIQNNGFYFSVGNTNNFPVNFDLTTLVISTNDLGNQYTVLSNLNNSIGTNNLNGTSPSGQGPYYRYESGTSMSAADVSGVLALMQDYFTNTVQATPSPALLKAMLINGARPAGYPVQITNTMNFEGWGVVNLQNSLPFFTTTNMNFANGEAMLLIDQNTDTALATGDSYTYQVNIPDGSDQQFLPLQVTLAWTDPPGNPAAAIKLVNSLELVVSNAVTGEVFYGNDFSGTATNVVDTINNVQNVSISQEMLATTYYITVIGRSVNVNAVTAQTNNPAGNYAPNVVQDYALVISCGDVADGTVSNAFTVTATGPGLGFVSNPTAGQQITYVVTTNTPLLNQFVGASTPLLGTNQIQLTTNGTELNGIQLDPTNIPVVTNIITLGMTNQWHFYVVTNTGASDYTNAAFITFFPSTLSVPRMGVFADSSDNATRPEADIDLYVSSNPALTNMDPVVISNADKSVGRGGTEYVYYTNSAPGDVYYVGVYSEDQEASEYGFIPLFTDIPFNQPGPNGSQIVNGLNLPLPIPDGSPRYPGVSYIFALDTAPMQVERVVVTDTIQHENYGDLIGTLTHSQQTGLGQRDVLNNHDSLYNANGMYTATYDDSNQGDITGSQPSRGPGSLNNFIGQQGIGPWILTEVDDAPKHIGTNIAFSLTIYPHQDLTKGITVTLGPMGWFYDYIDVPSGTATLTISATNLTVSPTLTPPVGLYFNSNSIPTLANTNEIGPVGLTNPVVPPPPPGNTITISSPPPGRYWVGLYNPSVQPQTVYLIANLTQGKVPGETIFTSAGPVPLLDDAVTTDAIDVPANQAISSMEVGLRVDHPRVSDLVFHLISPNGTRVLLVENRGGTTTNGMGATTLITNIVPVTSSGSGSPSTTTINLAMDTGTLAIYYNFYNIPDEMVVQDQSGVTIFDSGQISGSGVFNVGYTNSSYLTITMNPVINEGTGDLWDFTVNALQSRQAYLVLTEDTNKTTTPIKFAPTPFLPAIPALATNPPAWHSSFEGLATANFGTGSTFGGGWHVNSGDIDIYQNGGPAGSYADEGTNWVDLDGFNPGAISTNVATVAGQNYTLSFTYSRNPDGYNLHGLKTAVMQALQNGNSLLVITNNITNTSWSSLGWATTSVVFTATSNITTLTFQSLDPAGDAFGVFLDCIDLTSDHLKDGFENTVAGDYLCRTNPGFGGWTVLTNQVTVISNAALAYQGTCLLALADGTISRILPTVPGRTYTLSYAYRGPGAVGLWRAEANANDSIAGNNPVAVNSITYVSGKVGQAFHYDGSSSQITMPASASLTVSNFTIDSWVYPTDNTLRPVVEWGGAGTLATIHLWVNTTGWASSTPGAIHAVIRGSPGFEIDDPNSVILENQWNHLVFTFNAATYTAFLYVNGVPVETETAPGPINAFSSFVPVNIGYRNPSSLEIDQGYRFLGNLDEVSIYNRDLSASEILAIYDQGTNGLAKYNTNAPGGIAQGLAEAQLEVNGAPQPIFFGDDTNWQTATISFTATTTNTPLQVAGLEPGMLLDNFVMTWVPTNNYDLYYLPEQSLDTLQGENAYGQWQLEIQDDRAGATNPAPSLVSWQLRFNFNYTPPTIPTLTNGQAVSNNIVPPGGIAYYEVIVPTNADISTNILFNTTGPLNLLFDMANPPTGILPPDYEILSAPTGGGSARLTTLSTPTNFAAGGIYYLGIQNLNSFAVNHDIQVNFHLVPPPLVLPQLPELLAIASRLLAVTNDATGGLPPYTFTLTSTVPGPNVPVIVNATTNVITWTPDVSQAPDVYNLTNVVTDSGLPPQMVTNIYHVLVVLTNGQPAFPSAEGAGGFAIGGRGGDVYHVVNLNDSGPGSLRNGIISTFGSRTIVFDVSGAINLYSPLEINNPYLTIAGQTAPGAGVTIQGLTFSADSTHGAVEHARDEVVRFIRCRPGDIYAPYFQGDSFHFNGVTNSIADHLSTSWSLDDDLSTLYSTNVTVQWSMIAQSLNHSAYTTNNGITYQEHGYGSLIRYGSGQISYLHNLYADNYSRNPEVGDNIQLDFINNVVCNWGGAAGINEDNSADNPGGYTNYLNYRANYFIAGSNTTANPNIAFASGVPNPAFAQIYQSTNFIDDNPAGVLDGTNSLWAMFGGLFTQLPSPTPMPEIQVATNSPEFAYERVLDFAGATVAGATAAGSPAAGTSLLRDPVDTNIVNNVRNKSGQIVDFVSSNSFAGVYFSTNFGVTCSGYTNAAVYWAANGLTNFVGVNPWPVLASAPQPLDSDGDGIPDYWEITLAAMGTNSMNPSVPNNNHSNPDGYTDLEHYLNWLGAPHALTVSNTPVAVDLYAVVGRTGNLIFGVGNPTNGAVVLGVDGHTAMFMPSNNYFGFASFDFSVTNLDTSFGGTNLDNGFDVTVSVMVSITNITTSSLPLTNAVPLTNTVPGGGFAYFLVTVPTNAQLASNILLFASSPVNLWFSQSGFPTGTNTGDYILLTNSTGGISLLSTNSTPTNIVPGGTYYLGVQNPGGAPVNFALEVDFYPPPPVTPPPPVLVPSGNIIFVQITVPTNADFATNILLYANGPVNIWYDTNYPPTTNILLLPDSAYPSGTNGSYLLGLGTTPPLVPGSTYYLGVQNTNSFGVICGIEVDFHLQLPPVPAGGVAYYPITVPTNADFATNILVYATGPLNLWYDTNYPPTTNILLLPDSAYPGGTNGSVVLGLGTTPPLVPGSTYYLGVQNTNTFAVYYDLEVDFHLLIPVPPPTNNTNIITITSITATNIGGTNGFLLQWQGPANFQYEIQWTTNLLPLIAWQTVLNPVINEVLTATNGHFSFFDDGTLTDGFTNAVKFYRVLGGQNLGPINGSAPVTNTVLAGATSEAVVTVPPNAISATNVLISATGPLNVWFNQTNPPTGNISAGDVLMLSATNAGVFTLTRNSVPPLVPGANYYLGFQNTGTSNVTFVFDVAFGFAPSNTISVSGITAANIGTTNGFLLQWQGPAYFQYEIQWTTNLAPPIAWRPVLNPAINEVVTATNGHFSFFDDGTLTGGFGPMKFYRILGSLNLGPITGSAPVTNTVLAGAVSEAVVTVPASAISASNLLVSATGPLNMWFNQTNPPAGNTNAGDVLMLSATNAGVFTLTSISAPPLVPGTNYYLGFQNTGTSNVTFVFQAAFGFAPATAPSISSITLTASGLFQLQWTAPVNYQFQVEWTASLAPPIAWNYIPTGPPYITSGSTNFTFLDPNPAVQMKFYRLIQKYP